jgi:hypothetical protein
LDASARVLVACRTALWCWSLHWQRAWQALLAAQLLLLLNEKEHVWMLHAIMTSDRL